MPTFLLRARQGFAVGIQNCISRPQNALATVQLDHFVPVRQLHLRIAGLGHIVPRQHHGVDHARRARIQVRWIYRARTSALRALQATHVLLAAQSPHRVRLVPCNLLSAWGRASNASLAFTKTRRAQALAKIASQDITALEAHLHQFHAPLGIT